MLNNAFDPSALVEYVPIEERSKPKETQAVFLLKPLSVFARLDVEEEHARTAKTAPKRFTIYYVRKGLAGWRNFVTPDGKVVPFTAGPDGYASDDAISVAWKHLSELFDAFLEINSPTVEQVGKS